MKVSEIFPKRFASGEDLGGHAVVGTIARVTLEEVRVAGGPAEHKPALWLKGAAKAILLSRVVAYQLREVCGSDDMDQWPGRRVELYPVPMTVAGRQVTAIRARAPSGETERPGALADDTEGELEPESAEVAAL